MISSHEPLFDCPAVGDFNVYAHAYIDQLPAEVQEQFRAILLDYYLNYDISGAYERMNNRTASQIVAEYHPKVAKVVTSGMVNNVGFAVYEGSPPASSSEVEKAGGDEQHPET